MVTNNQRLFAVFYNSWSELKKHYIEAEKNDLETSDNPNHIWYHWDIVDKMMNKVSHRLYEDK